MYQEAAASWIQNFQERSGKGVNRMQHIDNPVTKGNYTEQDLREYAFYRKTKGIAGIQKLLNNKQVLESIISPDEHEDYREPLAITQETVITIELSTGGDADGFKLTFNEHKELMSGVYYWADWGVYQEVRLSEEELESIDSLYSISDWFVSI